MPPPRTWSPCIEVYRSVMARRHQQRARRLQFFEEETAMRRRPGKMERERHKAELARYQEERRLQEQQKRLAEQRQRVQHSGR